MILISFLLFLYYVFHLSVVFIAETGYLSSFFNAWLNSDWKLVILR